jgi:hypothetical protein
VLYLPGALTPTRKFISGLARRRHIDQVEKPRLRLGHLAFDLLNVIRPNRIATHEPAPVRRKRKVDRDDSIRVEDAEDVEQRRYRPALGIRKDCDGVAAQPI